MITDYKVIYVLWPVENGINRAVGGDLGGGYGGHHGGRGGHGSQRPGAGHNLQKLFLGKPTVDNDADMSTTLEYFRYLPVSLYLQQSDEETSGRTVKRRTMYITT
jgi:hypothetical protein